MTQDDLKKEALEKTQGLGRDAVKIAKAAVWIYPLCVLVLFVVGGFGGYYAGALYAAWLGWLCVLPGLALGAVAGYFTAGVIMAGLIGDLMFDAQWQTSKLGWKALRQGLKKKDEKDV